MAHGTPVISLKQDFDPNELTLIRLQQDYDDDTNEKLQTPIIDGRSVESNLYGLREFQETAEELSFNTGDELFKYFRRILQSTTKDDWITMVTDNGFDGVNNKTENNFLLCICAWKLTFVTKDACQELVDYLQSAQKPRAMQVESSVQR
jgi:hypothetical protein